jgi:membrane protein implicated in regulation of membrane protease activity
MVAAWLIVVILLLLFELHHLAFYALFGALGAAAAAVVALASPHALVLQAITAIAVCTAGVIGVRPIVSRAYQHRKLGQHITPGVHGGLVGQEAVTLDQVGDAHAVGHVRLVGEKWLAVSGTTGVTIPAGTPVLVTAVLGTTLVVWPLDSASSAALPTGSPSESDDAPTGADGR